MAKNKSENMGKKKKLTINGLTEEQEEEILRRSRDAEKGINMSPRFDNVDDAIKWLNEN